MNLASMANFICDELGVYDDKSVDLAKSFLDKEYRILWDKYPWSDTQTTATIPVANYQRIVPYPDGMQWIISMRSTTIMLPDGPDDPVALEENVSDSRMIEPTTSTFLIESDPDIFERTGFINYYEDSTDTDGTKQFRVFPTPQTSTALFIIGKATCPGLTADTDTSVIRNIDNVLIAYAYFDMLQRQRQYAKADQKRKEAMELEQVAWNLEQQQANRPRRNKTVTVAGNSLLEMTDSVCALCGQWTQDYRLIIKEFLRRNYQALYDLFLWPESVLAVRVPFFTEQVILPHYVDRVLGVRGANNLRLSPADAVLLLDITPSVFEEIGEPISYTTLTPVGVWSLPSTTTQLALASTSAIDKGKVFVRGEIIGSGQELYEEVTLSGTDVRFTRFSYDIPITIAKDITAGNLTVNAAVDNVSLAVIPANQRELKHQRLWLLPAPQTPDPAFDQPFQCLVLAKRKIVPLVSDQDTPIITGVQQVLIAAAAADVFTKMEKSDLATRMLQKAQASTDALKARNTDQAASAPRFVPQVEAHAYVAGCTW